MKPFFKAREMVIQMQFFEEPLTFEQAKHCASKAVDEIVQELDKDSINYKISLDYWDEVKQKIKKL